jgi:hypothetical protein
MLIIFSINLVKFKNFRSIKIQNYISFLGRTLYNMLHSSTHDDERGEEDHPWEAQLID